MHACVAGVEAAKLSGAIHMANTFEVRAVGEDWTAILPSDVKKTVSTLNRGMDTTWDSIMYICISMYVHV